MEFKPKISYDPVEKIWTSLDEYNHFDPNLSIGEIIYHEMQRHPKQIAQISATENTILTREELLLNSQRIASYMSNHGLLQSDIVGIIARNTTHISAVAYACFFNGIAFHSLNVNYEQANIEKLFSITQPRLIFCDGDDFEKVSAATKDLNVGIVTMRNHTADSISIEELLLTEVQENFKPTRLEQGNNQTMAIICSSGTTGTPKAVTIANSHKILNANLMLTTADVQYSHSTLDWITGLITTVTSAVFSTKRIIADNFFDPEMVLHLIEEHKITWLLLAPFQLAMLTNSLAYEKTSLISIRYCMFTGARCSLEMLNLLRKRLPENSLHFSYGMTEIGVWATFNWHFDEKPKSVGRLTTGFKAKILNEQNEPLGPNEMGEVCLHNGQYWAGYFGNIAESRNIRDSERWFHTGDLGYMDEDGFLYVLERKKDMLKYQNIMYYPHEVEQVIYQMPQVADVCVFGVWSDNNGDEAAAAVVKKPGTQLTAEDVVDYVHSHVTATYKQLNGGAIIMDDLKRSSNGKTNRAANKAYFLEVKGRN
ncbi:luciferin 4-monooxygenase-like [Drosophila innubila]|uniref:luciferin 4-monooxygenase-like n=1 Tax=Drosophila innubila TaxID=198719 RepID=UPI00148E5B82|nr:luciferin 4-monooxygenase-like [Drosophila innubila]XP_034487819.1 luciferin 4-monooxygenase-like [Drosophila innubila]